MVMRVGFIGFGEVAYTLASRLREEGVDVVTSLEGRSTRTVKLAGEAGVLDVPQEEVYSADIVISAVTPSVAIEAAKKAGEHVKGVYVDINNIAPRTVRKASSFIKNGRFADAAIMGSVRRKGSGVLIIAAGEGAEDFMKLNRHGLNIEVRGQRPGDASAIKMLRSSYTKGVSALLWETLLSAHMMGLEEDVMEVLEYTEGKDFRESTVSRLRSSIIHAGRRYEEMREVQSLLDEVIEPAMPSCIMRVFERLNEIDAPSDADYSDLLRLVAGKYQPPRDDEDINR